MSLINDALKRASSGKPSQPPPPPGAPMHAVNESPRGMGPLPLVLCIVGVGSLILAGAFWLKSKGTPRKTQEVAEVHSSSASPSAATTAELPDVNAPSAARSVPPAMVGSGVSNAPGRVAMTDSKTETLPPISDAALAPPLSSAAAVSSPTNVAVQTVPGQTRPAQPDFRLQAIYYRMKGPTVVINGKTLKVGDTINGAKLVAIERTSAELEVQGVRQKLTMR